MIQDYDLKAIQDDTESLHVVWFTATWCGPCKVLAPNLEKVSDDMEAKPIRFWKYDIDDTFANDDAQLRNKMQIRSVPTVMTLDSALEVKGAPIIGPQSPNTLKDLLTQRLG